MGREIRKVPPNWDHPKDDKGRYKSMYAENYDDVCAEWLQECNKWASDDNIKDRNKYGEYYWDYAGSPPDREYYSNDITECTWFQMYETVSEGTPVTPPFETEKELINYLTTLGTFWDSTPWKMENAERFVSAGYAPSMIVTDGVIKSGSNIFDK